jgi:hypothetical protein
VAGRDIVLDVIERQRGDALRQTAADLDKLADKAEVSGRSMREMGKESAALSKRIEEQTVKVRALASEIARGDADKGLFAQFRSAERDLGNLERVGKVIKDEMEKAGAKAGQSLLSGMSNTLLSGGSTIGPSIAIMVAGAAPFIAASVAGAVGAAVGTAIVGGGIVAAAQDPRVKTAANQLADTFKEEFARAGKPMVQPVLDAIGQLKVSIGALRMDEMFAKAAPLVSTLTTGVIGLASNLAEGLNRALDHAGPAVEEFAHWLPILGSDLGDAIDQIVSSKNAVEGLHDGLQLVSVAIRGTADVVTGLATAYKAVKIIQDDLNFGTNSLIEAQAKEYHIGDSVTRMVGALGLANQHTTQDIEAQTKALQDHKHALDDTFNSQMSLDRANLAVASEWNTLKAAIDANGRSLDATKEKGNANRGVILQQIDALGRQRDAAIAAGDGSQKGMDKANAAFNKGIDKLIALADKAGYSKRELEKMAKPYYITVTTTYIEKYVTKGTPGEHSGGRIADARASGGPVTAGQPYIVGEHRPELFVPSQSGYIMPHVPTATSGGGPYGGGGNSRQLSPLRAESGSLAAVLIQVLQEAAQRQYGGDPVLMLSTS